MNSPAPRSPVLLDWSAHLLPQAVDRLLGDAAPGATLDLAEDVVVLPGGRARRRFEELLVEGAEARGLHLIPPAVTTIGALPERLFERRRPVADASASALAWAEAVGRCPARRLGRLYGGLPEAPSLHERLRIGRQLQGLHREVARARLRFDAILSRVGGEERERWQVLVEIQATALRLLDEAGLDDPDMARIEALDRPPLGGRGTLWLVGTPELPGITRALLEREPHRLRVLIHAPEERAEDFDALGGLREDRWAEAPVDLPEDRIHFVADPIEQAHRVAELIAEAARVDPELSAETVVVGALDAEVVPVIREVLAQAGLTAREAAGRPVDRTAPVRLLKATAELLSGYRWEGVAAWLRHPDVDRVREAWGETHGERAAFDLPELDRWYRDHLPSRIAPSEGPRGGVPGAERASLPNRVLAFIEHLLGPLAEEAERPLSAWVEPLLEYLARVFDGAEFDTGRREDRALLRALDIVGRDLQRWRRLPGSMAPRVSAADALRVMLDAVELAELPNPPEHDAIDVLGWLELPLDDAALTIVTGVGAGTLPEALEAGPFLDERLRTALGLATSRTRRARDAYRLAALHHSRTTHLISARTTASGDPVRPSPLVLEADTPGATARRVLRFQGRGVEGEGRREDAPREAPAEAAMSSFRSPPQPELVFAIPDTLRATDFRGLIADPYLWALERILGLREVDDRAREMDGALFGTLAHAALEAFGGSPAAGSTDVDEIRAALDEGLEAQVQRRFGVGARHAQPTVRLQVEQLRARLHHFAEWQAGWRSAGWEIRGVEVESEEGGVPFVVDDEPIGIRATIDRIDHHPASGRWMVWDYKTSDSGPLPEKQHRAGPAPDKRWVDLQLPLYRWLAGRLRAADGARVIPEGSEVGVGYILLPRDLAQVRGVEADWSDAEHAEALEVAAEVVRMVREGRVSADDSRPPTWSTPALDALLGHRQLVTGVEG
jgi:hypothetical protein